MHSLGYNWQKVSIGWVKGLVPNRRQAIAWTNDNQNGWGYCSLMAPMVSDILVNTDSTTGMIPYWHQTITSVSPNLLSLPLWHQSKRADILQTAFQMHFHEKKKTYALQWHLIKIHSWVIIGRKSALNELMARCLTAIICTIVVVWPHMMSDILVSTACLKYWLDAISLPGHYRNQSWVLVNGTLINSL